MIKEKLNLETAIELTLIYKKFDVTILPDIFQDFVETCYENHKKPVFLLSLPGLMSEAEIKHTQIEQENIQDPDIVLTCEIAPRSGILGCMVWRYAVSVNDIRNISHRLEKFRCVAYVTISTICRDTI